jgi:NADH:ubiquinone oxidoreductase subunit K
MHLVYPAVLAALLFCVGLYGVLARRNAILMLMSVELMLAAVSLNLVAFDVWLRDELHSGQVFTLFLIPVIYTKLDRFSPATSWQEEPPRLPALAPAGD